MKELNLHQVHTICLNISKEFDKICTRNNIPYYMLGGTMLGAIRHVGFIPWDDDMDFGVPIEYFDSVITLLKDELPTPYRCLTYKDSDSIIFPYFKIEDSSTVISELHTNTVKDSAIGVNIDIFPLYSCNPSDKLIKKARKYVDWCGFIYADSMHNSTVRRTIKYILRFFCPIKPSWFIHKSLIMAKKIQPGNMLANIFGRWEDKESIPLEWYGNSVRYTFNGYEFIGIEHYDNYLKKLYKDYMKLPPESKRILHGGKIYLRD